MLLACTMLKYELDKALVNDGMYCSVSGSADLFPTEKMTIHIHCEPIFPSGLPYEVNPAMPIHALNTVREVINRLATEQVDPAELNFCKTMLTDRQKTESGNTAQLRDAVLERNSVGRDIRGGFSQRITGVQPSDMRKLFEALTGCTCEYVVQ